MILQVILKEVPADTGYSSGESLRYLEKQNMVEPVLGDAVIFPRHAQSILQRDRFGEQTRVAGGKRL
jgi:hypothetical protein